MELQIIARKAKVYLRTSSLVVLCAMFMSAAVALAKDSDKLAPNYRNWLEKEVVYIINNDERKAFLKLPSDEARTQFINDFWEVRNPSPGSPNNEYKDEIYRRLAYANDFFGRDGGGEGWRTARGRAYIVLGPPQQRAKYLGVPSVRAMEIWFYGHHNYAALPPAFYILFYQQDPGDDFRFYSPYMDGPNKLVLKPGAENDRVVAFKEIDRLLGREVSRTTLNLLPDSPVDTTNATSDLTSDMMINTLKNIANHPFTKDDIMHRRQMLEGVSHRVILGGEFVDLGTVVMRDADGTPSLHYVIRLKRAADFTVGENKTGYFYNFGVSVRVSDKDGKTLFSQERKISHNLSQEDLDKVKAKPFGFEGKLPLAPGKYKVEFVLSNLLGHSAFRTEKEIFVPAMQPDDLQVTDLVPFVEAHAVSGGPSHLLPFTGAGVQFVPRVGQELELTQGQDLSFFYQIWATRPAGGSPDSKLDVEYAYGRMGAHDVVRVQDQVTAKQFDAGGSLINGKKIPTLDLAPGTYRMVLTVHDAATGTAQKKAFSNLIFRVSPRTSQPVAWDISDEELAEDAAKGISDYQRALCYLATDNKAEAQQWIARAFDKDPRNELYRERLVQLYFGRGSYAQITEMFKRHGITEGTADDTILRIAESFDKVGDIPSAIRLLESATSVKTSSGPLYIALSGFYSRTGQNAKASDAERKGKALISSAATPAS